MFYTYVIKSLKFDYYYKGHCENLDKRIEQHNSGMTESIKIYVPFVLVYFEEFETREETIKEKNILRLLQEEDF